MASNQILNEFIREYFQENKETNLSFIVKIHINGYSIVCSEHKPVFFSQIQLSSSLNFLKKEHKCFERVIIALSIICAKFQEANKSKVYAGIFKRKSNQYIFVICSEKNGHIVGPSLTQILSEFLNSTYCPQIFEKSIRDSAKEIAKAEKKLEVVRSSEKLIMNSYLCFFLTEVIILSNFFD